MNHFITSSLLALLVSIGVTKAQEIRVLRKAAAGAPKAKGDNFYCLEPGIDTTTLVHIATIEIHSLPPVSVERAYEKAKAYARQAGGNSFLFLKADSSYQTIRMNLYRAGSKELAVNKGLEPKNTFFIFAGERSEKPEYYSFEYNGAAKSIKNGSYFTYRLKEGESVKLKKGMIAGTTMWLKWKPNQSPDFYSIHGFFKEPVVKRTTVNQPVRPGKFTPVEKSFGRFLSLIFPEG